MAYETAELEKIALNAIKQYNLTKIQQIVCYMPCSRSTFYEQDLDKSDAIKEALYLVRESKKKKMTDKWENSDNPTLQIAAYKLIADEDELIKLNSQKIETEHTFKGSGLMIGFANDDNNPGEI